MAPISEKLVQNYPHYLSFLANQAKSRTESSNLPRTAPNLRRVDSPEPPCSPELITSPHALHLGF